MRVDLHCHSRYSPDALVTLDGLLRTMDRRGIDRVAITDHDTMAGALEFHTRAPDRILVGQEIKTAEGELLALFLQEEVPAGLSPEETIEGVRAQGGLVGVSHPLDRMRGEVFAEARLEALHPHLDFFEVFNARVLRPGDNRRARKLARQWGLPGTAGSDAHTLLEVGRAYVEIPEFDGPGSFLEALTQGQVIGRLSSPLVHPFSTYARWRKRWTKR
jgi:predicted metal-dependent phosphoesterase TrpH